MKKYTITLLVSIALLIACIISNTSHSDEDPLFLAVGFGSAVGSILAVAKLFILQSRRKQKMDRLKARAQVATIVMGVILVLDAFLKVSDVIWLQAISFIIYVLIMPWGIFVFFIALLTWILVDDEHDLSTLNMFDVTAIADQPSAKKE